MADTYKAPASASDAVTVALERYHRADERDRDNRVEAYADLEFYAGDQWPAAIRKELTDEGRPALEFNQLPTFARQVMNDIRMMRSGIKVVPVDSNADPETAEIMGGMVRYVENRSDAQHAYNTAMESQVVAGIGHWQIVTEYASERTFEQEIRIVPIEDGVSVLWDPDSVLPTREDAMWCFQPVDISHASFKERYPKKAIDDLMASDVPAGWNGDDTVRIARYWCKKPVKRTLALMPDGSIIDAEDPEKLATATQAGARVETRDGYKITQSVISATDVLEEERDWPGRFIPVIPVLGEEVRIGRTVKRRGIFRFAKDAQRMYNMAMSAQAEAVAMQPKAPWLVTEDNVKAYAAVWLQANKKPLPYLPYTPDQANGGQAPIRAQPAIASQGMAELTLLGVQTMKDVIGIQNASLGKQGNETSGRAITARQREGDVGMYAYIDNFGRGIRHTGTVLIDLIPRIYDTQRIIRVMGEDGTDDLVPINTPQMDPETGMMRVTHDLSIGAYDVVTQQGPGYTTRREEARDGMLELAKMAPDAMIPIMLDLIAKAQDWPMAEQIAKRAKAVMNPAIIAAEEQEEGAPPPPPDPPGPDEIKAQADAEKAVADAKKADAEFKIKDMEFAEMLADSVLGPDPAEQMAAAGAMPGQMLGNDPAALAAQPR